MKLEITTFNDKSAKVTSIKRIDITHVWVRDIKENSLVISVKGGEIGSTKHIENVVDFGYK